MLPAQRPSALLSNYKVVLVAPKEPGNIGAALRASANFGVGGLSLVAPRCSIPNNSDIYRLACDSPLLQQMQVYDSLHAALAESVSSIGFSRRAGGGRVVHTSISTLVTLFPQLLHVPQTSPDSTFTDEKQTISLVFGREESGLTDEEVSLCAFTCAIDSNPSYPSLNLSHAVAVVVSRLYELQQQAEDMGNAVPTTTTRARQVQIANQAEIEALLARGVSLMERVGMDVRESSGGGDKSNHGRRRKAVGHVRAMVARSMATRAEVRAMHGILKHIEGLQATSSE